MNAGTLRRRAAAALGVTMFTLLLTLVAGPALARAPGAAHVHRIEVVDDAYVPMRLTIRAGDAVDFVWSDHNFSTHNVTLEAAPRGVSRRRFSSPDATRRVHFQRTFTVPGSYRFMCTIHPEMTALVVVRPARGR